MPVESFQGGLEFYGQAEGIQGLGLAAPFPGHPGADVFPEVAKLGRVAARDIVGHRHAGQFDDAAFDGVHERKVVHGPVEQGAFDIAGTAQKEGCCRKIDHTADAQFLADGFQPRYPQSGGFPVFFGFLAVISLERAFLLVARLFAIAVVGLIVEHQDLLDSHELGHDPLEHLPLGLQGLERFAPPLKQGPAALGQRQALPPLEGVIVGDDNLRPFQIGEHVARNQLTALVIAVRIVGLQHAQAILDGNPRGNHQKAAGEPGTPGTADGVDGLPGNQHGHDGGLAGSGRQLEGQPRQARIGFEVGHGEMVEKALAGATGPRRHFSEPDGGLQGLDLAEEGTNAGESVVPPVAEQTGRLRGDLPLLRVWKFSPPIDLLANVVDDCGVLVLLLLGRKTLSLVEDDLGLFLTPFLLLRLRDGRDEIGRPAAFDDLLGRLARFIQLPVPFGVLVGRIEDGSFEEWIVQVRTAPLMQSPRSVAFVFQQRRLAEHFDEPHDPFETVDIRKPQGLLQFEADGLRLALSVGCPRA